MPPNVLLVVFDTARADAFGPYGAPPSATPTVDDLARRGTTMPMAIATSSWTMPSHVSMFTGLAPRAFGLRRGAWTPQTHRRSLQALFERHRGRVLAELLRGAGYDTRGVSANGWIASHNGFSTGFRTFDDVRTKRDIRVERLATKLSWYVKPDDDGAVDAHRVIRGWLRERPDRPFFWFVNLMECHAPYYPPRAYNDLGPVDRWRSIGDFSRYQSWLARLRVAVGDVDVPPEAERRMRHLYGRSVRLMDDWLARLLEGLEKWNALDETLVVVTSDHGENLGDGHLMGHVLSLDQRLVRVPVIAAGPGAFAPKPLWSLGSLPAAIANAVGLEQHPWGEDAGADLAFSTYEGLIQTPAPDTLEKARKLGFPEEAIRRIDVPLASVTDGRFKLVRTGAVDEGTTERLYDLETDPLESADAGAAHPQRTAELRAALQREDARWAAQAAGLPDPYADTAAPTTKESAEIEQHLRALGYL